MAKPTELDLILRALELMQGEDPQPTIKKRNGVKAKSKSSHGKAHSEAIKAGKLTALKLRQKEARATALKKATK